MIENFYVLHQHLVVAQRDRPLRPLSEGLWWLDHEKLIMFGEVNRLRLAAGRDTIDFREIEWAEQQAAGHFDYTKKFALHCAELVTKE